MKRCLLALLPLFLPCVACAAPSVEYSVVPTAALDALDVSVCLRDARDAVAFSTSEAPLPIRDAARAHGTLSARGAGYVATGWRAGECLRYRAVLAGTSSPASTRDAIVTDPARWMLRPEHAARAADAEIAFELPSGTSLSVPWQAVGTHRYAVGTTPPQWAALVAIGTFDASAIAVDRYGIRPAVIGATEAQARVLRRHASEVAHHVARTFPRALEGGPQILMLASGRRGEPVSFGESYRGGAHAIVLYVDPGHPPEAYDAGWTLTHELAHLAHPYLGDDGRWISEGIASYYQNVIRARAGRITPARAWAELDAGFGRGRRDRDTRTLRGTSAGSGHYMRTYWSGAALALRADVAWRTRAVDPTSLDVVLDRYLECCRTSARVRPERFLDRLDALAGGEPVFGPLFREHADRVEFPSVEPAYEALARAPAVRDAIMRDQPRTSRTPGKPST